MSGPSRTSPPSAGSSSTTPGVFDVTSPTYGVGAGSASNQSAAIQAALNDAGAYGGGVGGKVVLPAGVIIAHNLVVPSLVSLEGQGFSTVIQTPSAQAGGVSIKFADQAIRCGIRRLRIDGNRTTGATGDGIEVSSAIAYGGDAVIMLDELFIRDVGRDGVRLVGGTNSRMAYFSRAYISLAARYGLIVSSTDNHVTDVSIGGSGQHGCYVQSGGDSMFHGLRSFFSGTARGAATAIAGDYSGIRVDAGVQRCNFYGFETQDNALHGVDCAGDECVFIGSVGGENQRQNTTTQGALIKVGGSRNRAIIQSKSADLASTNTAHLIIDGATAQFNDIEINGIDPLGTATRVTLANSGSSFSNKYKYNGGTDQVRTIASGAASVTLASLTYVATLTANLTLNHVAAVAHAGAVCKLVLRQDATGGRTVTFPGNSVLKNGFAVDTVANRITTVELVYDGTNWLQSA